MGARALLAIAAWAATRASSSKRLAAVAPPVTRLVGPKMHKTGSTTLGGILARAANRYGWKARLYGTMQPTDLAPRFGPRKLPPEKNDILYCHVVGSANHGNPAVYHIVGRGEKFHLKRVANYTSGRLAAYAAFVVPRSRLLLALREPLSRYVSMMNYFTYAEKQFSRARGCQRVIPCPLHHEGSREKKERFESAPTMDRSSKK